MAIRSSSAEIILWPLTTATRTSPSRIIRLRVAIGIETSLTLTSPPPLRFIAFSIQRCKRVHTRISVMSANYRHAGIPGCLPGFPSPALLLLAALLRHRLALFVFVAIRLEGRLALLGEGRQECGQFLKALRRGLALETELLPKRL